MLNREDMKTELYSGVCKIVFTKANGDTRVMQCTLNESMLPQVDINEEERQQRKENDKVIVVWDLDKLDWRSFRVDSVTLFSTVSKL